MKNVQIYMATDLDQLIDQIDLQTNSIFQKHTFITQTNGINHYLKIRLAEKYGVISNFEFLTPNELIMDVAHKMGNLNSAEFSTENIRWRLFQLLDSADFKEKFPYIHDYYSSDELKRIQLSTKLADLFDQYTVFRTDMMIEWQNTPLFDTDEVDSRETWQKWLWTSLKASIGESYLDKAEYQREAIKRLQSKDSLDDVTRRFPSIHVFGLTVLTKFHLEILWNLSNAIKVDFYFLNPCVNDFWYDCLSQKDLVRKWSWNRFRNYIEEYSSGNELLTGWGKVSQELFAQLFNLDDDVFSVLNYIEADYQPQTLLEYVQRDIHENIRPGEEVNRFSKTLIEDKSIQIKSNYTEAREVEVFYDYLVDLIDNQYKGDLQPHDVIVMLPDVELYLPYIKAVFDHAPKKIPYSIGDRPANREQSLLTVCLTILRFYTKEFTSESVVQLLDYEIIRDKYGINDLDFIRQITREANIRFGIKGDKSLETNFVAWETGLKKMFFGVFSKSTPFSHDDDLFEPLATVEGINAIDQTLQFVLFVRRLIFHANLSQKDRELTEWNKYFMSLVEMLSDEDLDEHHEEINQIKKRLDTLDAINEKLKGVNISFETYLYIIKSYHNNEKVSDGYFRGRVTFCQALPMRSIPFKVVAFLGLNTGDFPRSDAEYSFDIIKMGRSDTSKEPKHRLGDRSTKENDKYLFLEALLSAKDKLFLSYLGVSVKNNKAKNPSLLVDELLNYIQQYADKELDVRKILLEQHPLNVSSKTYLDAQSTLFTYLNDKQTVAFEKNINSLQIDTFESNEIDFSDVLKFYNDPIKYYYNKVLGIYYNEDEVLLPDSEVFELEGGLEIYHWKNILLESTDLQDIIIKGKKDGKLPLGNIATCSVQEIKDDLEAVIEAKNRLVDNRLSADFELETTLGDYKLKALIKGDYIDFFLQVITSKNNLKYHYKYFIEYLLLVYAGIDKDFYIIDLDGLTQKISKENISRSQSEQVLLKLIDFYLKSKKQLVPFNVKIAQKILEEKSISTEITTQSNQNVYFKKSLENAYWDDLEVVTQIATKLMEDFVELFKLESKQ